MKIIRLILVVAILFYTTACTSFSDTPFIENPPISETIELPVESLLIKEISDYIIINNGRYDISNNAHGLVSQEAIEFAKLTLIESNALVDSGEYYIDPSSLLMLDHNLSIELETQYYAGGYSFYVPGCGWGWLGAYVEWWGQKISFDYCGAIAATDYSRWGGIAGGAPNFLAKAKLIARVNPVFLGITVAVSAYGWWINRVNKRSGRGANLMTNRFGTLWVESP